MSDTETGPVDPMDDPERHDAPPTDDVAIETAQRMNDAEGPQPGVSADPPETSGDDPVPDIPG